MRIKELFNKEITRRINPAVVVSEMDEYSINQEIDEYVFTNPITKNMFKFLDAIANKKEGKTGVWISGYYGSGKSHFIKYLFYCLNSTYGEKAFNAFKEAASKLDPLDEPNPSQIALLEKRLQQLEIDEIIFNIDAVSQGEDSKDRITRVLLNQLNAFRGYNNTNIALALYLEKPLDKSGLFEEFKARIKSEFNEEWSGNQLRFSRRYLERVIRIASEFDPNIDQVSLKSTILEKKQDYTIEFLIDELKDFLGEKSADHRLMFLIDEVSQYIGSDTILLLNLQTIVEEIGAKIGTKVWVVCTAQQELKHLIDSTDDKTEDFGKIFGRFETMISLESQDAAFITKKRLLDKNSEGIGALNNYYKKFKGSIENQFIFDHDLYQNYTDREDFMLTYPFIPYQFRLISDVFESFSNVGYVGEGVRDNERAILGITHYTTIICKDREIGYFVPFDLFFNEQLEKNLTHHARNILDRAYKISNIQNDSFARRLVNTLFMISNLGDSKSINFPANIENLALLMMEAVDTPKLEVQHLVQNVLDELVNKNIIQVTEGKYRFLKEDEIEVAQLIKNTAINNEDRLDYFYKDIISKVLKPDQVITFGNRNFRISFLVDEKQIGVRGDFNLKFSVYDNTDLIQIAHNTPTNDMVVGISEWFRNDTDMKAKVLDYIRTQKFISLTMNTATGTRLETLYNFRDSNIMLLKEITKRFERKFMETDMVSKNQVIKSEELNTSAPASRFQQMIKRHMEELYSKNNLSNGYASNNLALITAAKSKQINLHKSLSPAEEELNSRLNFEGESPVVGDIVKLFEKPPYGWKDITTLDVLLNIARKGYRRFEWRGEEIDLLSYADKAINSKERDAITILKEKTHSQDEVDSFIHLVNNEIFAESLIPSGITDFKLLIDTFKTKLSDIITHVNSLKESYESWIFSTHLKSYYNSLAEIYQKRNNDELLRLVYDSKSKLIDQRDKFKMLEDFLEHNFSAYHQISEFVKSNGQNFESLDEILEVKAKDLTDFIQRDIEPWDKFPQMKKAYKELHSALTNYIKQLKEEIIHNYEKIFDEIEVHRLTLEIKETNLTTDSNAYIAKIKKENQIPQLEIFRLKYGDIKAENFKRLDDFIAEKQAKTTGSDYAVSVPVSLATEMPPTTINTPEQLDDYLKKLREKLMIKLAKNKKLFLN